MNFSTKYTSNIIVLLLMFCFHVQTQAQTATIQGRSSIVTTIPNNNPSGGAATINISGIPPGATVVDIEVQLSIFHEYAGDISAELRSPGGGALDELLLFNQPGSGSESSNLFRTYNLTFNDAFTNNPRTMGSTIGNTEVICRDDNICDYYPQGASPSSIDTFAELTGFINGGSGANGDWEVKMIDHSSGDSGVFTVPYIRVTFTTVDLILTGTTGDDDFHVVRDGNETVVTLNGSEISRVYSLGLNSLTINGGNGNDLLIVDYDGGDFQHPITFNGGNQNGTPGDIMQLDGTNNTYASVNHTFINDSNGTVSVSGNPILTYSGLEPIVDNLNVADRVFNYNGGAETITLEPSSTLHNIIDSTLGESVDFNNPTNSLTINAGYGNDRINIEGVHADFDADLTINGGNDDDDVYVQLLPTDIGNGALDIDVEELTIEANLIVGGNISIDTERQTQIQNNALLESTGGNITINTGTSTETGIDFTGFLCSNSTVRTANGDIAITAKGKSNGTSYNSGISISNDATVTTTGTGAINLNGTGGNGISRNYGVSISTSTVSAPGGGDITITGNSGVTAGDYNQGVRIVEGNITVASGNLSMNGVSQNTGNAGLNLGVWLQGPSDIKSTDGGNMTFTGTGGTGPSGSNVGIIAFNDIQIFNDTSTGFIQMTGTGGTNGDDNDGIIIQDENTLISTNGGGVTLTGNGGNSTVGGSHSGITMVSGTIRDQGTGVVQLHGTGGNSERGNYGLLISEITGDTSITANGGGIIMTGNAGINSSGIFSGGIAIIGGAVIRENATGNIQLNGTGGTATAYADGIIITTNGNDPSIIANSGGDITLTGTGGTASTLSFSDGIIMDSGTIRTYSGGNIVLNGTSGTAAGNLTTGIYYDGTNALINANGNLTISGSCTDATGVDNAGVLLLNPTIGTSQGDINITGSSTDPAITAVNHITTNQFNSAAGNFSITGIIGKIKTPAGQALGEYLYTATNTSFTGILAPGQSPGEVFIGGNLILNAATTLEIEVNNFTTAGIDYDHINTGFIDVLDLGGATLNLIDNTTAVATGTEVLTLIHNGDLNPITGTFNGLPHGTDIPFNGETWRILYNGGTNGNDVVLVSDLEAPVAVCQDITLNIGLGGITVTADQLDGGSTDNVGVETILINGEASLDYTYDDLGDHEVTITVVDVNGNTAVCTANITLVSNATFPILISEYQPAISGNTTQEIEIKGEPGESFAGTFVVIEGINSNNMGVVLSADDFSGTFDANGLLTATIPDLRSPSHTAVLTSSFSGTVGVTDVDTDDDGTVDDITSFGLILDAVGITNGDVCCPVDVIYGAEFGGVDLAYIGGQAAAIFRTASVGDFYQISLSNSTIYDNTATIVDASVFSVAPIVAGTFGSLNPTFIPAIIVPQVIGELQADAETAITTAGFTVGTITTEYSLTIPAGIVIDQSPTAGNLIQSNIPIDLVISGGFNPDEFITKWQTTDNETIVIPFDVGGSTTINWGDGTIETITVDNPSHTYTNAGQYLVSATENINYIRFNNGGNKLNILEVVQWGNITWSTMLDAFKGCENLQITATDAPDLSLVTSTKSMFRGATSLTSLNEDNSQWDVSNVRDMSFMFRNCYNFNQDISSWDVSNVLNFASFLYAARVFNYDLNSWDMSSATEIRSMFFDARDFNQDLSAWDISNVGNANKVFSKSGLSTANYDAILTGWSTLDMASGETAIPNAISFGAEEIHYCSAVLEREALLQVHGWTIVDADEDPGCAMDPTNAIVTPFITKWETTTDNESITIPTTGGAGYFYTVDWGDGDVDTGVTGDATHIYTTTGIHTVSITAGFFPRIYFNNGGDALKLIEVSHWGNNPWLSMENAFFGCENLIISATDAPNLSNATSMRSMFRDAANNNNAIDFWEDISHWDVSTITDISELFRGMNFNQDIDIWDVGEANHMGAMFRGNEKFNQDISSWDVSNVTNMSNMFYLASDFNQDISDWDVSKVQNMIIMFRGSGLNQDLSAWDISSATNMANIFTSSQMSVENYDNTLIGWVTLDATTETQIPMGVPFGANNIYYCEAEFKREELIQIYGWNITDAGKVAGCNTSFITTWETTTVNETITIPTFSGETYNYLVNWGDGTTTLHSNSDATTDASHTYATTGEHTVSITGDFPRINFNFDLDGDLLKIQTVEQWGTIAWSSMDAAFAGCSNLTVTATDTPDLSNAITTHSMFFNCSSLLGNVSFNTWDVSTIEDMGAMFSGATNFNTDLNNWNVANATNMSNMFSYASNFNGNISTWNTGEVTNMSAMFRNNTMFEGVSGIGNWNVSKVENMTAMFENAIAFNQDLGAWDISAVTTMTNMLNGVSLSTENYDNTLIGWATDDTPGDGVDEVPTGIVFEAGNSQYCNAEVEREDLINTYNWTITGDALDPNCNPILLSPKVYLQGASLNPNTGEESLMRDDLRIAGIIPTRSPYEDMITCETTVFDVTGDDAIVDWVWVELRDEASVGPPPPPGLDDKKKSALLQRDGDIVDVDGVSPLSFSEPADNYHIIVKHRNHLSIMSVNSIALSSTVTTVDFTDGSVSTYGTNAQTSFGMPTGISGMWTGNVNNDTVVQYSGTNPDTPDILSKVLNDPGNFLNFPTFAVVGYNTYDINMDGSTQYSGTTPDTPFILQNVLAHPGNFLNFSTYQITEQLPDNNL